MPVENPIYLLTALSLVLYLSYRLSKREPFKSFGIALLAIIFGAVFSNLGLIPTQGNPTYDAIFEVVAPAALFLLLLDANLMQLRRTGIPILVLFLAGSNVLDLLVNLMPERSRPRLRRLLGVQPPMALGTTFDEG